MRGIFSIAAAGILFCSGCAPEKEIPVKIDLSLVEDVSEGEKADSSLKFGLSSNFLYSETYSRYKALISYLSGRAGEKFEFVQRRTGAELIDLLENGGIALARIRVGDYLKLGKGSSVRILAAEARAGSPHYRALVIVPSDSPIREFGELRGKSFAFSDKDSLEGHHWPAYLIKLAGFDKKNFFSRVLWSGNYNHSILLVADDDVDGACVSSRALEDSPLKNKVRIIGESPLFFAPPIILAGKSMTPQMHDTVKASLLNMHRDGDGRAALRELKLSGFVPASDADYAFARKIAEAVK
ncbi:MAG: PhnD/SsuA/transferrin family substrate-binding protein [Candidatus Omnitrophota bacterium]|nr:PhnD/SsuA/transferrin family substrate-binding protein [Candidatus Omnitrophota bacterium]MBU2528966.1 PhnD/SsuA/transferrin family substrate-binding protein [bacterium]MBU3930176.1 PhnD/SsuA/transferrin family substrate-binding protein [bacterium]MBU4122541.1 PhnD/SsuA/transferrin family substrate-binding protein [bacterium]